MVNDDQPWSAMIYYDYLWSTMMNYYKQKSLHFRGVPRVSQVAPSQRNRKSVDALKEWEQSY
mgnify:CR=1 FL=1